MRARRSSGDLDSDCTIRIRCSQWMAIGSRREKMVRAYARARAEDVDIVRSPTKFGSLTAKVRRCLTTAAPASGHRWSGDALNEWPMDADGNDD